MNYKQMVAAMGKSDQCIMTDKATAKKIISFLVTKGWWFACFRQEGDYHIVMSISVNLKIFHTKGYKFTFEGCWFLR